MISTEKFWAVSARRAATFKSFAAACGVAACGVACSETIAVGAGEDQGAGASEASGDGGVVGASAGDASRRNDLEAEESASSAVLIEPSSGPEPAVNSGPPSTVPAGDGVCSEISVGREPNETALLFALDTSGSMSTPTSQGISRLEVASSELLDVVSTLPQWVHAGLFQFPAGGVSERACGAGQEVVPMYGLGPEDSVHRERFESVVARLQAQGNTPLAEAFDRGIRTLVQYGQTQQFEDGKLALVLFTDTAPERLRPLCRDRGDGLPLAEGLPDLAREALEENDVATFVLSTSADARDVLSATAELGGTASDGCSNLGPKFCHLDLTGSTDFASSLRDAFLAVSDQVIDCTYDLPTRVPNGQEIDRERINVRLSQDGNDAEDIFFSEEADCAQGWTFSGDQVQLCKNTCERVKTAPSIRLELLFGCRTRVDPMIR